ncbi:MAG: hypothetical protein E7257_08195 [Lachnospiraceae bacterium]|nr:hypothetical protein [Lachnospiraceae bacterium]
MEGKLRPNERREELIYALCKRRKDKVKNLAFEFNVSVRTMEDDIKILSLTHPIITHTGRYGGGVEVADGYYVGRKYLKPSQKDLLERLSETLSGDDLATMKSIFYDFTL